MSSTTGTAGGPRLCGDQRHGYFCLELPGHAGDHRNGAANWPQRTLITPMTREAQTARVVAEIEAERRLGRKADAGKPRMSLVPWRAMAAVVRVLEFGAKKYGVGNWLEVKDARTRYFDAGMRHLLAWWEGERNDAETGEPHLAHAVCCLLFLMHFDWKRRELTTQLEALRLPLDERLTREELQKGIARIQDNLSAAPATQE